MADGLKVTQREIKDVMELEEKVKDAKAAITAKLFEGATVEPGERWAMVEIGVDKKSVTKKLLTTVLGEEKAETVWTAREDSPYRRAKWGKGEKDKKE